MIIDILFEQLGKINFEQMDYDEVLDQRDFSDFDSEWCRVEEQLKAMRQEKEFTEEDNEILDDIREKVFLEIYNRTNHDDMAAYISDDFGLICESELLDYKDDWLNKLIECYQHAQFPYGEL